MKKKRANFLWMIICMFLFGGIGKSYAAEKNEFVDPNVYEEKEISIYKHYERIDDVTRELHEDLRELTFERQRGNDRDTLQNDLFLTTSSEKNTILAKATNLNLFSEQYSVVEKNDNSEDRGTFNRLNILLITIFVLTIVMLIALIPKLNKTEK
ncbi:MAG TPA: type VII secretion protein EssA [Pseudogracilibacillus sp.]|nr:type VII secretion protein EssA [Pseudogracilibacillus sp.]